MNNVCLDIHADDYALSNNSDNDIIRLCKDGKLDSISVIPNLEIFDKSVKNLFDNKPFFPKEVKASIHINVMEGKCCAAKELLPDLVDKDGYFIVSWGKLFFWNFNPFKRKKIKKQLEHEIAAQINKCVAAGISQKGSLRIDSHQHPHMIPLFFDSIIAALNNNNFKAEYIRNSMDPTRFYVLKGIPSISNIIKCFILNFFSIHCSRILKKRNLPINYLCGVFYSGKMDKRIEKPLKTFLSQSNKQKRVTELLFHPGRMLPEELTKEFTKPGFNDFHISQNRTIEFNEVTAL